MLEGVMLCWIFVVGGLLIMMGQHDRSEALFYYFRLDDVQSARVSAFPRHDLETKSLLLRWLSRLSRSHCSPVPVTRGPSLHAKAGNCLRANELRGCRA